MVDEQEPAKRVVKRVVKKAVVRPAPAAPPPTQAAPPVRYGRPVVAPAKLSVDSPSTPHPKVPTRPAKTSAPRERVDIRGKVAVARQRTIDGWWLIADGATDRSRTIGGFAADRARAAAHWRLPQVNGYLAAAITGAVVGAVAVLLGIIALSIFDTIRGVSSGGGFWGSVTFAGIAIIAGFAGEALLRGFGSTSSRVTSFFAIVLVIIALLGLFLELADTWVAVPLVPLLGVAAFSLARWLVDIAENAPSEID